MDFDHTYADYIDENGVEAIQGLERETGTRILACCSPPGPAHLSNQQLKRIEEPEQKLCVRLVAYNTHYALLLRVLLNISCSESAKKELKAAKLVQQ